MTNPMHLHYKGPFNHLDVDEIGEFIATILLDNSPEMDGYDLWVTEKTLSDNQRYTSSRVGDPAPPQGHLLVGRIEFVPDQPSLGLSFTPASGFYITGVRRRAGVSS
jgi:hypothetical protein